MGTTHWALWALLVLGMIGFWAIVATLLTPHSVALIPRPRSPPAHVPNSTSSWRAVT